MFGRIMVVESEISFLVYVSVTLLIIMTSARQEIYGRKAFFWHMFLEDTVYHNGES